MTLDKTETSRHTWTSEIYMTRAIHFILNDKDRFPDYALHPVEMTSAEQDPDPDSPAADDHTYHSWVTVDHHHFDHNLSDSAGLTVFSAVK